jgi:hypothetical protein
MTRSFRLAAACAALALAPFPGVAAEPAPAAAASRWAAPAPGSCAPSGGLKGWPIGEDAPAVAFQPGDVISLEKAPAIKAYLPPAIWEQRDKFFFEGMRLEIGPCFRDYAPPEFFGAATEKFRGAAKLSASDGLEGHTAGLPFAPDSIDPADPKAGEKWAWNVAQRYQAGGLRGRFRVSDMVGRSGRAEPFEGEIFRLLFAGRADRAGTEYQAPGADGKQWVAGGIYSTPFAAREYAWRQFRSAESLTDAARSDELWAYLPEWRRVRRINASQVEGLYMPSFSVGVQQATEIAVGGGAGGGATGAASGGGGGGTITTKRSGFEGLEIRPLLYGFRVLGVQDVLAPINAANALYPAQPDRDFGPWGLSFASDRWDLRRALVLEGTAKDAKGGDQVAKLILYVDLQTLHPLYYLSFDSKGESRDVGMYVGRWSEDRADYPKWPDDPARPVRVIDSVGASFANLAESGGWRRESWDLVATPPDDTSVKQLVSVGKLTRGH